MSVKNPSISIVVPLFNEAPVFGELIKRIDEINILQATLESMRKAVLGVIQEVPARNVNVDVDGNKAPPEMKISRELKASCEIEGCYLVCGRNDERGYPMVQLPQEQMDEDTTTSTAYHVLVDGNRVPKDMPCEAESMVKGDSREYAIGAASILAKVTRDRLMHEYDLLYPEYGLKQHKGYPTAAHMATVRKLGATAIHRRTFAPLKHMIFDDNGNILKDNN